MISQAVIIFPAEIRFHKTGVEIEMGSIRPSNGFPLGSSKKIKSSEAVLTYLDFENNLKLVSKY